MKLSPNCPHFLRKRPEKDLLFPLSPSYFRSLFTSRDAVLSLNEGKNANRFKIPRGQPRAGSSPASGILSKSKLHVPRYTPSRFELQHEPRPARSLSGYDPLPQRVLFQKAKLALYRLRKVTDEMLNYVLLPHESGNPQDQHALLDWPFSQGYVDEFWAPCTKSGYERETKGRY